MHLQPLKAPTAFEAGVAPSYGVNQEVVIPVLVLVLLASLAGMQKLVPRRQH
eukprot:m.38898 g.38898  ORF g.38898 m.38898 type:complete len:52 (+) comp12621_c0_seq19:299-454(+)